MSRPVLAVYCLAGLVLLGAQAFLLVALGKGMALRFQEVYAMGPPAPFSAFFLTYYKAWWLGFAASLALFGAAAWRRSGRQFGAAIALSLALVASIILGLYSGIFRAGGTLV